MGLLGNGYYTLTLFAKKRTYVHAGDAGRSLSGNKWRGSSSRLVRRLAGKGRCKVPIAIGTTAKPRTRAPSPRGRFVARRHLRTSHRSSGSELSDTLLLS